MVALTKNKNILQSFIYKPITEEFMYADSTATYLNNKNIKLNKNTKIENSIGSISSKYWDEAKKTKLIAILPWWANGPYSPGLSPCCYPPEVGQ